MRYTHAEKVEMIHLVETSDQPVKRTLAELGVPRSTFSSRAWMACRGSNVKDQI